MGYSGQLFRYAKDPISEDDFPPPGEDVTVGDKKGNLSPKVTGGVPSKVIYYKSYYQEIQHLCMKLSWAIRVKCP